VTTPIPAAALGTTAVRIDAGEVELAAAYRATLRRFLARAEAVTTDAGLTPQRYDLLLAISAAPSHAQRPRITDLCEALALHQTAVTELVKRAAAAGLVERCENPDDRRESLISLTPEGERRFALAFGRLQSDRRAAAEIFRDLGERFLALR
jgi:DNA-binding MarR family transcriptional regulator